MYKYNVQYNHFHIYPASHMHKVQQVPMCRRCKAAVCTRLCLNIKAPVCAPLPDFDRYTIPWFAVECTDDNGSITNLNPSNSPLCATSPSAPEGQYHESHLCSQGNGLLEKQGLWKTWRWNQGSEARLPLSVPVICRSTAPASLMVKDL